MARRAAVAAAFLCAPAALRAQAAGLPALEILGDDSVSAELKGRTIQQTIFIRNTTARPLVLRVSMPVRTDSGAVDSLAARPPRVGVPGGTVVTHRIEFDVPDGLLNRSFGGYLVLSDPGAALPPAMRWTSVAPPPKPAGKRTPLFGRNVLITPLLVAAAAVLAAGLVLGWMGLAFRRMKGTPTWDFARSWASTTTLATAFANGALIALIPKPTQEGLAALAAVFAVVVLIAPSAYNLTLRPIAAAEGEPRYEGHVLAYLFASMLTLWGVLGALYCGYLLISKVPWQGLTADRAIRYFQYLPWLIAGLVVAYAFFTILRTVKEQTTAPPPPDETEPDLGATETLDEVVLKRRRVPHRGPAAAAPHARPAFPIL